MNGNFDTRVLELEALAREQGLDFFNVLFEVVPMDIMHEIAAYGLPTRAQHWSYGKVYNHQKIHGEMGLSRIYEIVLNNDPTHAFLLDTNPEIVNLLVAAHVFGHADFFKHSEVFRGSNRNMMNDAVSHALRVDEYIERYGLEAVEHIMDIGFALDRHIDPHLGTLRKPYPERKVVEEEQTSLPYADLIGDTKPSVKLVVKGDKLPPPSGVRSVMVSDHLRETRSVAGGCPTDYPGRVLLLLPPVYDEDHERGVGELLARRSFPQV